MKWITPPAVGSSMPKRPNFEWTPDATDDLRTAWRAKSASTTSADFDQGYADELGIGRRTVQVRRQRLRLMSTRPYLQPTEARP